MGYPSLTGIAGDPQRNIDFYAGVTRHATGEGHRQLRRSRHVPLLLRRRDGRPGSILTFFPWPEGRPEGRGLARWDVRWPFPPARSASGSSACYARVFATKGRHADSTSRCSPLPIPTACCWRSSPLPGSAGSSRGRDGPVSAEHAVRGAARRHHLGGWGRRAPPRSSSRHLGMKIAGEEGNRLRLDRRRIGIGSVVDSAARPGSGAASRAWVRSITWRSGRDQTRNSSRARGARERRASASPPSSTGNTSTPCTFSEPGGVLYEIATDGPGFTIDETPAGAGHPARNCRRATSRCAARSKRRSLRSRSETGVASA